MTEFYRLDILLQVYTKNYDILFLMIVEKDIAQCTLRLINEPVIN